MGGREDRYISGSFCVSMTAAMGMPKLETGPQKSGEGASLVSRSAVEVRSRVGVEARV